MGRESEPLKIKITRRGLLRVGVIAVGAAVIGDGLRRDSNAWDRLRDEYPEPSAEDLSEAKEDQKAIKRATKIFDASGEQIPAGFTKVNDSAQSIIDQENTFKNAVADDKNLNLATKEMLGGVGSILVLPILGRVIKGARNFISAGKNRDVQETSMQ